MAGEFNLPNTSERQKLMGMLNQFYDYGPQYAQLQAEGQRSLDKAFGAAQQNIGSQFTPAFRMAQARLGGSPLLADSGYANRLNRQLQQSAFGQLSNAYGGAAADQAAQQQDALSRFIQARLQGAGQIMQAGLTAPKKRNSGMAALGGLAGAGIGAFGGPLLGAMGSQLGKKWAGG